MAGMPRYPSFYLLGALAGFVLWLIDAPPPFPFLGMTAMIAGGLGLVLSLTYLATYEPWQWRVKLVTLRRALRAIERAFAALSGAVGSPPMTASQIRASRARS